MEDLRSSVGWLWLKAVNKTFSDLSEDVPWEDQIEDIREVITDLRDQLKVCRARLRNQTSWQDNETWMRMRIAGAWMKATQQSFADVAASWEEQLDEIESEISLLRKHNGALRQQNERAHKRVEELEARRTFIPWTVVHAQFSAELLTWTQSFDALMSQCGMPMEEALSCLAENFDRRGAIDED